MDKGEYRHSLSIKVGENHWMGEKVSDGNYGNTERNDGKNAECFLNVKFDVISQLDESITLIPEIEERLAKLEGLAHRRVEMMLSKGGFVTAEQMPMAKPQPEPEPEPAPPASKKEETAKKEVIPPKKEPIASKEEESPAHYVSRLITEKLQGRGKGIPKVLWGTWMDLSKKYGSGKCSAADAYEVAKDRDGLDLLKDLVIEIKKLKK